MMRPLTWVGQHRRRLLGATAALALALALSAESVPTAQAQGACRFVLGFATLATTVGSGTVGQCLENQQTNLQNGDAYQRAAGGLLVWRKADNWTAFTDGFRTWVNGPRGLQQRLNTQRYSWEGDVGAAGTSVITDAPPVTPPAPPAAGFDPRRFVGQGDAYNCGDFQSQADAQAVLRAAPSDPNRLDADRDGIACESNRVPRDLVRVPR